MFHFSVLNMKKRLKTVTECSIVRLMVTPLLFCIGADSEKVSLPSLLLSASLYSVFSPLLAHTSSFYSAHGHFVSCPEFEGAAEIFLLRAET